MNKAGFDKYEDHIILPFGKKVSYGNLRTQQKRRGGTVEMKEIATSWYNFMEVIN